MKNRNNGKLTSDFLALTILDFEAFVKEAVRLSDPGIGSALEYPELISSVERM